MFKAGVNVAIRHFAYDKPLICPIIKTEENCVFVLLLNSKRLFFVGDTVAITYYEEEKAYLAEATISNITDTYGEFNITSVHEFHEKETNTHYSTSLIGSLIYKCDVVVTTIKEVWLSGCCINADTLLSEEDLLNVSIIADKQNVIEFRGRIIRKAQVTNRMWEYTIMAIKITDDNTERLKSLLLKLEIEELAEIKALEIRTMKKDTKD